MSFVLPPTDNEIIAFHSAALKGNFENLQRFVQRHPGDIDCARGAKYGRPALLWAAKAIGYGVAATRRVETVTYLLDHGAAIDTVDTKGLTALAIAAKQDDRTLTALLIGRGATVSPGVVVAAAGAGMTACLKKLFRAGGDPDAPDQTGVTPRAAARENGKNNALQLIDAESAKRRRKQGTILAVFHEGLKKPVRPVARPQLRRPGAAP